MRTIKKNDGSVMIILIIIMAATISFGLLSMNIAITQYQIKKTNSEIIKCMYLSEDGINRAYVRIYNLICDACNDSLSKTRDYLTAYPDDSDEAEILFKNGYKVYVLNGIMKDIQQFSNPVIELTEMNGLAFVDEMLTVHLKSKYTTHKNIEKTIRANFTISVPDYADVETDDCFKGLLRIESYDY